MWKIIRLFVQTFTSYGQCSVLNREYLTNSIHIQLSKKQKKFCEFFSEFLKYRLNFEHIKKKDETQTRFKLNLDKKDGKLVQTLLKSEQRHVYHIY